LSPQAIENYLNAYLELKARYFRVIISLFVASVPQGVLYDRYLESWETRRFSPVWDVACLVPWLVYLTVTFLRVPPPIMPRTFQRIMRLVVRWYVGSLAVLAILAIIRPGATHWLAPREEVVLWAVSLFGCVAVPTLLRCSRKLREGEATS
jgi:hypothetical protein